MYGFSENHSQEGGGVRYEKKMEIILDRMWHMFPDSGSYAVAQRGELGQQWMISCDGFPEEMKWGSKVTKYIVTDKWDQDDDDWDNDDWDNDDWDDDDWDDDDRYDEQDDWDDDDERRDNMNGIANILENNGKASYKDINSIKSNVYTGSIHLKKGTDTDVITVESIDINEKLGFRAFEKDGILYLTSNKKIKKSNNIGKGTITVTIPENMAFNEIELNMKAGKLKADQIRTKNLEVNAGAGEVNILEFQAEEAEFVCGAGSVTASGDAGKK